MVQEKKNCAQELQEELMKNNEAVNEDLTTPVIPPATVIPQPPPEIRMLDTKEQKLDLTAAHRAASMEELLLLDPP